MEDIFENYLTENIPPDLLAAYKDSEYHQSDREDKVQHFKTNHRELASAPSGRRFAKWDYGKSTYKVITPEEAKAMVKRDKESVVNLRVLYHGTLVEFEVRRNDRIYPIYGPGGSDDPVTITNPDGSSREYPNLRYLPFNKMLDIADKIYVTDEYDHPISAEKAASREEKKKEIKVDYNPRSKGDIGYDEHNAIANWNEGKHYWEPSVPDTGAHESWGSTINVAFKNYSDTRKALKRLEREKVNLDDEDYEYQKERLTKRLKDQKAAYDKLVNERSREYDHTLKRAWEEVANVNQKLRSYIRDITYALDKCYTTKKKIEKTKAALPDYNKKEEHNLGLRLQGYIDNLEQMQRNLENKQKGLEDDMNGFEIDVQDQHADPEALNKKLDDLWNKYENVSEENIQAYLKDVQELSDKLNQADAEVTRLRPHETARKAAKRNAEAKLDAGLADIIDFVEFK